MCSHVFLPERKTCFIIGRVKGHTLHTLTKSSFITIKENKKGCKTHLPNFKRKSEPDYQGN